MKIRLAIVGALAAVSTAVAFAAPAQAAPAPVEKPKLPATVLAGHTYDTAMLMREYTSISYVGGRFVPKPGARPELVAFAADANSVAPALSPCTNKIKAGRHGNDIGVRLPSCLLNGVSSIVGAAGAILGAIALTGVGAPVAGAAATVIGAMAAALVAINGYCDIFGPGNGVVVSIHIISFVPPTVAPPTTSCW